MKTLTESVLTSFDNEWDVMPAGRIKTFHSAGAICPIEIKISEKSPFTGLFKPGKIYGLVRLGPANKFPGMMPGASIKFLRTNVTSGNVVVIAGLNPLPNGNYDFFDAPLPNHIGGKLSLCLN